MAEEHGSLKHEKTDSDSRREKFKERSRGLERGVSAPLLSPGAEAKAPLPFSVKVGHGKGHQFAKKTFFQPTFCHHCTELLWGLKGQGLKCPGIYCTYVRACRSRSQRQLHVYSYMIKGVCVYNYRYIHGVLHVGGRAM